MADSLIPADHLPCMMLNINKLHYSYLYAHESLQKLEEKKRLEGHIREYLMIAPHEKKFCYNETSFILHKSAQLQENFNGIRASAAWTAIAAYAHNLLAQSWRKEFREIKTYSGFYKHNVETGLIRSELMLTLMGYRETGEGTYTLEGPVDPDKVATVSLDSLIALVECQILCTLYGDLLKNGYNFRWLDILEYRESHICSIEQTFHGLIYQYNQRYLSTCRPECYTKCTMPDHASFNPVPYRMHHNIQYPSYYSDTTDGLPMISTCHIMNPLNKCTTCHKDYSLNPPLRQTNTCSVPTAKLIELDVSYQGKDNYLYDSENHQKYFSDKIDISNSGINLSDNNSNQLKHRQNSSSWDGWGSYQIPDNKKYPTNLEQKHSQYEDWTEPLKALRIDDSQPSTSTSEPKLSEKSFDKNSKKKAKHDSNNTVHSSVQTLGREVTKRPETNYMSLKVKLNDKWECPACTFHNTNDKDVCEMCSKSKIGGNDFTPLVSGGRQCPQCTLVNEKGVTECDACHTNLKDSPTYI